VNSAFVRVFISPLNVDTWHVIAANPYNRPHQICIHHPFFRLKKKVSSLLSFNACYLTTLSLIDQTERRWNDPDSAKPSLEWPWQCKTVGGMTLTVQNRRWNDPDSAKPSVEWPWQCKTVGGMTLIVQNRRWNDPDSAKPKYLHNSSPDVTLSTTNNRRSGKVILSVTAPRRRIGGVEI